MAGERHLDAGLARRTHPALHRVQNLPGHRAPEAGEPRLRDWTGIPDHADRRGLVDARALRVRQDEPHGLNILVMVVGEHLDLDGLQGLTGLEGQCAARRHIVRPGDCLGLVGRVVRGPEIHRHRGFGAGRRGDLENELRARRLPHRGAGDAQRRLAQRDAGIGHRHGHLDRIELLAPVPATVDAGIDDREKHRQRARLIGNPVADRCQGADCDAHLVHSVGPGFAGLAAGPEHDLLGARPVGERGGQLRDVRQGAVGHGKQRHRDLVEAAVADHPDGEGLALTRRGRHARHVETHGVQAAAHPVLGKALRHDSPRQQVGGPGSRESCRPRGRGI